MKILIICNYSSGLYTFRGMLIQELVKRGHIVKAIVPETSDQNEKKAEENIKRLHCGLKRIPMERRGMNPIHDLKLMKEYLKTVSKMRPDIVLTYTIKPNIYGGLICRILRVPYAVNITGLGTAFQKDGMLKKMVTMMYKTALKRAKVVFFENVENRDIMVSAGIVRKERTHVLAGAGVDLEHFAYAEYPSDSEYMRFLFIGRVMQEKGIDELFQAMRKLNKNGYKCSLDVLGGFEENYLEKIKQYEKEGWLHYQGYQEDVRPFIEKSHCFVLPSWHEGMANTNLEAAATGRPVITSNIHGCMEAVEDGVTGYLCEKQSVDSLYEKMKLMCELSSEDRKIMGAAGRTRMKNMFSKRKVVEKTIQMCLNDRMRKEK